MADYFNTNPQTEEPEKDKKRKIIHTFMLATWNGRNGNPVKMCVHCKTEKAVYDCEHCPQKVCRACEPMHPQGHTLIA